MVFTPVRAGAAKRAVGLERDMLEDCGFEIKK
jgi:hypothetical protein